MNKTNVEAFGDMVNMILEKESFPKDPNAVNSVYIGQIALSLAAITDELHELNENLRRKRNDTLSDVTNKEDKNADSN